MLTGTPTPKLYLRKILLRKNSPTIPPIATKPNDVEDDGVATVSPVTVALFKSVMTPRLPMRSPRTTTRPRLLSCAT